MIFTSIDHTASARPGKVITRRGRLLSPFVQCIVYVFVFRLDSGRAARETTAYKMQNHLFIPT